MELNNLCPSYSKCREYIAILESQIENHDINVEQARINVRYVFRSKLESAEARIRELERQLQEANQLSQVKGMKVIPNTEVYVVLSIRELLKLLVIAQQPSTDGSTEVKISNCVVLKGKAHLDSFGKIQLADWRANRP